MCAFLEEDKNGGNPKVTFIKFDENFKLDTIQYRIRNYDMGCNILNDSITLTDADIYYIHADSTFPLLSLSKPAGIINVPEQYKISFYPNPIKTNATFEFENSKEGEMKMLLFDNKGSMVKEMFYDKKMPIGKNITHLNFEPINKGIYYLTIFMNNEIMHTIKLIKE